MYPARIIAFCLLALPLAAERTPPRLPIVTPEAVKVSPEKLEQVDQVLQKLVADGKLAGVTVAAARHGKVFYFKAFGQADLERKKAMEEDSIVRIYSMTKAITSTAVMMEWEKGRFQLEDPVSKYIPSFKDLRVVDGAHTRPVKTGMKVVDLLRHSSGLGYGIGQKPHNQAWAKAGVLQRDQTLETFTEKLSRLPLNHDPATTWLYGVSIDVLGRLVEIWSGEAFDTYLEKRIFKPLHMQDTAFYVPKGKADRFAANYRSKGRLSLIDDPGKSLYLENPKFSSGGGGLCSTAEDYLNFLVMLEQGGELFGTRLLRQETVELMTRNHLPEKLMPIRFGKQMRWGVGFGLGFNVRTEANGKWDPPGRVGEFGWGGKSSTHYWISPADGLCVVTLEQTEPYSFMTEWAVKTLFYEAME